MSKIYTSIDQLIGRTPLLRLVKTENALSLKAKLFVKLEYFNPGGSVKDRVAKAMIEDAEKQGILKKRFGNNRAYFRQHRNRTRVSRRGERI